jgi:hypothetical protein
MNYTDELDTKPHTPATHRAVDLISSSQTKRTEAAFKIKTTFDHHFSIYVRRVTLRPSRVFAGFFDSTKFKITMTLRPTPLKYFSI